ncbi:hypothetical protein HanIR_Chr10g0480351 [Helianthus annuus]|nr:hypothetical protein HanIR_Chr10g0480351 [Helianthus annuus]
MYADDVVFMGNWDEESIFNIMQIMRCFHLISGLKLSHSKSNLFGLEVGESSMIQMANSINCKVGIFGILVGANMNQIRHWTSIIDCFKARLSLWKTKTSSVDGRLTLLKSVLDSLPLYFFCLFKAPKGVLDKLDALRRQFFWGG